MSDNTLNNKPTAPAAPPCSALEGVEWIWLDLDDTIYDFAASSLIALRQVYDKYALNRFFPDVQQWIDVYHRHNAALWALYNKAEITQQKLRFDRFYLPLQEGGADDAENVRLNPLLDVDYLAMLGATGLLIDGAKSVLEHLKSRGYKIGILSNGFREVQHEKLRSSGIDHLIDVVVLSDDININKPDRRIYDYALQQAGTTADASLMIGDNPATDIAGAIKAGWKAILFSPASEADTMLIEGVQVQVLNHLKNLLKW